MAGLAGRCPAHSTMVRNHESPQPSQESYRAKKPNKKKQKSTEAFPKNPHNFGKKLFQKKNFGNPECSQEETFSFFSNLYKDPERGKPLEPLKEMKRPPVPKWAFSTDPPSAEELRAILKNRRNAAAPGPNGIPYTLQKMSFPFQLSPKTISKNLDKETNSENLDLCKGHPHPKD